MGRPRTRILRRAALAAAGLLAATARVQALAPGEPPGGEVLFGAWISEEAGWSDSAVGVNARLGFNVPVFQIGQAIPLPPYDWNTGAGGLPDEGMIELTGTDAAVFLTVYPVNGWAAVAQSDLDALAAQLDTYVSHWNRTTFLRYAPEMQGVWNLYGNQPTSFKDGWNQMYTTVKAKNPNVIIVWAPNMGDGYPWGQDFPPATGTTGNPASLNVAADQLALDTSGDGALTEADDPYSPYFPGFNATDWLGLSVYYKGLNGGNDIYNAVQTRGGYCEQIFDGVSPSMNIADLNPPQSYSSFYYNYCVNETDTTACMMSESGAAWHMESSANGTSPLEVQSAWIEDCITNATWFAKMPRVKMIMQFEQVKNESTGWAATGFDERDYRITNDTGIREFFQSQLSSIGTAFTWANPRAIPTSIPSAGQSGPGGTQGSTPPAVVTATIRERTSQAPTLFGVKIVYGGGVYREAAELSVLVVCGMAGMLAVMRWL